jgi:hypothetical protein
MSALKHIIKGFYNPVGAQVDIAKDESLGTIGKIATSAYVWGCHQEPEEDEEKTVIESLWDGTYHDD